MAGITLEGYPGRVPCPHCGSTDCVMLEGKISMCSNTGNPITEEQLRHQQEVSRMRTDIKKLLQFNQQFYALQYELNQAADEFEQKYGKDVKDKVLDIDVYPDGWNDEQVENILFLLSNAAKEANFMVNRLREQGFWE